MGDARVKTVKVPGRPAKRSPDRLPWPRMSDPDESGKTVPLGIDVAAKRQDIIRIVGKFFSVKDVPMEELLQEVYVAIIHKNYTRSAHNPSKSSFGHYVYMVANNVCINLVHRKRRYDKESDSIDAPASYDDSRSILDVTEAAPPERDVVGEHMEDLESSLRKNGMWDLARYIRAARSGARPDVIREALSWGGRKVSNKTIRDLRSQIQDVVKSGSYT